MSQSELSAAFSAGRDDEELREYSPNEIADDVLLACVDGVGPATTDRLIERFGSATAALNASFADLRAVERVSEKLARKIVEARQTFDVAALLKFCADADVKLLVPGDVRYPSRLREIDRPPRLLFVRGEILPQDRRSISIVGTRHATSYGRAQATRLARELAELGFTITSGLALGIDGCAHRAALDAKGRTLAVLGGGVARIYPSEHEDLAGRILSSGALISEYHPLMTPLSGNFPARNRLVSGLSIGTIVIESDIKGGSMITARVAADQNREVFALPGNVGVSTSRGCLQLLREGATLVETVEDVLNALPLYELPPATPNREYEAPAPGSLGLSAKSLESIARKPRTPRRERRSSPPRRADVDAPSPNPTLLDGSASASAPAEVVASPPLSADESALLHRVGASPISIDELIRESGFSASRTLSLIAVLEFKKVLQRLEGNAVVRR